VVGTALMVQPEVYFVTKPGLIEDDLTVTDADTKAFLGAKRLFFENQESASVD
jgi:hypothetical protein